MNREEFINTYITGLEEGLASDGAAGSLCSRQPEWSEALAVGSQSFVKGMKEKYLRRFDLETEVSEEENEVGAWFLKESEASYNVFNTP